MWGIAFKGCESTKTTNHDQSAGSIEPFRCLYDLVYLIDSSPTWPNNGCFFGYSSYWREAFNLFNTSSRSKFLSWFFSYFCTIYNEVSTNKSMVTINHCNITVVSTDLKIVKKTYLLTWFLALCLVKIYFHQMMMTLDEMKV